MSEAEDILIAWLKAHDPDDWHQVATDWNWDAGVDVLAWIAAQPDCDRATAQYVILMGAPDYYVGFADRAALLSAAPYNVEVFDLIMPIIARWNAGAYERSQIASFEPGELASHKERHHLVLKALEGNAVAFHLDGSIFQPLSGQEFSDLYAEGWPPEVQAELQARGIAY